MANPAKLEFATLNMMGEIYMTWTIDLKMHVESMGLSQTVVKNNKESNQNKAKAIIFIRKHLDESLKEEYLCVEDPKDPWNELKEIFDHQMDITLPDSRDK